MSRPGDSHGLDLGRSYGAMCVDLVAIAQVKAEPASHLLELLRKLLLRFDVGGCWAHEPQVRLYVYRSSIVHSLENGDGNADDEEDDTAHSHEEESAGQSRKQCKRWASPHWLRLVADARPPRPGEAPVVQRGS